jgi:hypothetical protein
MDKDPDRDDIPTVKETLFVLRGWRVHLQGRASVRVRAYEKISRRPFDCAQDKLRSQKNMNGFFRTGSQLNEGANLATRAVPALA